MNAKHGCNAQPKLQRMTNGLRRTECYTNQSVSVLHYCVKMKDRRATLSCFTSSFGAVPLAAPYTLTMRPLQQPNSLFVTLILLSLTNLATSVCYYPNGYSATSEVYKPCVSYSGTTSMCCATNRTNPSGGNLKDGFTADECLENGICLNKAESTDQSGNTVKHTTYWRDQCTTTDWASGGCLNVCTQETV